MEKYHNQLICSEELLEHELKDINSKENLCSADKMLFKRLSDELETIKNSYLVDKKTYKELCDKARKYEQIKNALDL